MASLVSTNESYYFTGQFGRHFETFSRNITVQKKPIETFSVNSTNNVFPGYSEPANISNITYTPISGVFPAIIRYNLKSTNPVIYEAKTTLSQGQCQIKVQNDCRDFILNGVTENIVVDGYPYFIVSDDGAQNYLGLMYYYFILQRTK